MEYQITEYGLKFRVLEFYGQNNRNNKMTKGRFNSQAEAQAWVDLQNKKRIEQYNARKGHLQSGSIPDVYGENLLSTP